MQYSDTTGEYYRVLSKSELARTRAMMQSNWNAYTRFTDCNDLEEAFDMIEDDLSSRDLAYAWATRLGTLRR